MISPNSRDRANSPPRQSLGRRLDDRYGIVLIALIAALVIMGLVAGWAAGRTITVLVFLAVFFLTLRASAVSRRTILRLTAIVPAILAIAVLTDVFESQDLVVMLSPLLSVLFVLASMAFTMRRLGVHRKVTTNSVYGSLCIYLFLGLLFAIIYQLIGILGDGPFFAQTDDPRGLDYIYFSFVTMTTLGFGDLSPVNDLGKMTATVEAVFGQLYLVVVVALFVSRLGLGKSHSADDPEESKPHQPQAKSRPDKTDEDLSESAGRGSQG